MKTNKFICVLLALVVLIGTLTIPVMADDNIKVVLNGAELSFDVLPQLINGRTMVPMRRIFEALGADVEWDGDTQTITATKGDTVIIMQIDTELMRAGVSIFNENGDNITSTLSLGKISITKGSETKTGYLEEGTDECTYMFMSNWKLGDDVDVSLEVNDNVGKTIKMTTNIKIRGMVDSLQDMLKSNG